MSASPAKNPSFVTRFAPSPTGFLHIGGARTALFNWLFARHNGGQFQLRIEDTDRVRSTKEAIDAIIDGMRWLGLDWDGEITYQFERAARHAEVAQALLAAGKAYKCFATAEELEAMRAEQRAKKQPQRYDGRWRDRDPSEAPAGTPYVVRLKAEQEGETTLHDLVQGTVTVKNAELDDMVLLRSDGTPTYMLAVVVDDHDMGVNHVIRGDDHLNNTFRQLGIIRAMNWDAPKYAHIPLIHGPDGAKLSKRHGALGVEAYRDDFGYLPEAIDNYLLRLGWGHGDDEIISREQAIEWFDLSAVGRSPSRFDFKKLENINGHYIREADDKRLTELVIPRVEKSIGHALSADQKALILQAMPFLKPRAKNLNELAEGTLFLFEQRPLTLEEKAAKQLASTSGSLLAILRKNLGDLKDWDVESLEKALHEVAEQADLKMGKVAQPLRAALTGRTVSPGIFDVMSLLGREESLARLDDQLSLSPAHS
ncbi:glutamate--tRNA ligase [Zymomonas mobilis]|uniref:Glutamate--tRNA ligase n=1 Tax=Zymomonas mobilis subsp. pomaceae (strain ATCC 29192 / DSM 22645 / JCM 10191 / CCUG 17912 / NBRC 13757 / NCIMB 11200 / NRRL B-4491 / Barker I) TaxID=579138 RepID=F8ETY0_ZYMMT|nr:glutamate--tRNA ligase [Zymomonas mobilis]AEI38077.1 glutamyl-tRNA synthetase [Zymomonas mobilis subsp. pomaceae ATCC 29192]MDX5949443.1 glutamate--tRNA ligase [Zymomonas mobilis subsp. pomaceae]GEB89186.1 glutamate--tRNA ligase 2 [Zymomonas mobilis subsp. pomaceae]